MPKRIRPDTHAGTAYLHHLDANVRSEFVRATPLPDMPGAAEPLTPAERQLIVRQALILIEQNYVHLPLKRAMHAVDPVQRLKLLLQQEERHNDPRRISDLEFHGELTDIFTSLRDLHTNYLLPEPYSELVAFLPFMVEDCFDARGTCRYLASHLVEGFEHPTFERGVEILQWNGMPIDRAVRNNAQRFAGSNRDARHARGVQNLTTRALRIAPPPDEDWVIVGYRTRAGRREELRFDWVVSPTPPGAAGPALTHAGRAALLGIDVQQQIVQRTRAALFAPRVRAARHDAMQKLERGERLDRLESSIPQAIEAQRVNTTSGPFGYVRIRSFNVDPELLVYEFVRLVAALPKRGLILDVRGNGGGIISAGEYLLQLICPRQIEPEPVQFTNTPLNLDICTRNDATSEFADLSAWKASMDQALSTGSTYSGAFPLSDRDACNAIGQRYFGPVVLITDALCYSTTDVFAAGFQDHAIGPIIGTHWSTGAGGANVWNHEDIVRLATPNAGYAPLPRGAGMRVAMRRTLRVGSQAGTPVEDLGVAPKVHHALTEGDILRDNVDLKNRAGALLAALPVRDLVVTALAADDREVRLRVATRGISRIDAYVDDRPATSAEPTRGKIELRIPSFGSAPAGVELRGFADTELVARFRVTWDEITEAVSRARAPAKRSRNRADRRALGATPNVRDDWAAAAELSFAAFGGPALAAAAATADRAWRVARSLLRLLRQVDARAPNRSKGSDGTIGDAAHQARTSDHNPWVRDGEMGVVTACDITHDPDHGCDVGAIAESIRASRDARVKYVIWNRRIANSSSIGGQPEWTWRPYAGSNPHTAHIHVSVKADKASYDSEAPWTL